MLLSLPNKMHRAIELRRLAMVIMAPRRGKQKHDALAGQIRDGKTVGSHICQYKAR